MTQRRRKEIRVMNLPVEIQPNESFTIAVSPPDFKQPQPGGKLNMLATKLSGRDLWITTLSPVPYRFAIGFVVIELEDEEDIHGEGATRDAAAENLAKKVANRVMGAWLHLKTLGMDRLADSMVKEEVSS